MTYRDITSAPPAEVGVAEGRKVVAVVGIDRYRAWPGLDNAVHDARGALAVFQRLGFEQIVAPLIDGAATADAIRRLVTDDLATLGSDDSLVLFFAGHGHTRTRTLQSGPVETGFLIPVDGDRADGHAATWLRIDSWLSDVARLPARHILVILDACHSGIALGSVIKWRGDGAAPDGSLDELRRRQSRRVITSALGGQRAMDGGPVHGHSLFTGCLIEALTGGLARDGRREATGSELGIYVQRRVTSYTGSQQTPDFGTLELDHRGELVVPIATGPAPPRADPSPPPEPGHAPTTALPREPDRTDAAPMPHEHDRATAPPREHDRPAAAAPTPIRSGAPRNTPPEPDRDAAAPTPRKPDRPPPAPTAIQRVLALTATAQPPAAARNTSRPKPRFSSLPVIARVWIWSTVFCCIAVPFGQLEISTGAGILSLIAVGVLVIATVVGRLVPDVPSVLRWLSAKLLARKLWTGTVLAAAVAGTALGMAERNRLEKVCREDIADTEAVRTGHADGARATALAAAKACRSIGRDDQARLRDAEAAQPTPAPTSP